MYESPLGVNPKNFGNIFKLFRVAKRLQLGHKSGLFMGVGLAGTPMRRRRYPLSVIVRACLSSPGSKHPLASLSYIAICDNKSARKPFPILAYSFRLIKQDGTRIANLQTAAGIGQLSRLFS